jgi:mannose-1-phosphate guanylyltransferase
MQIILLSGGSGERLWPLSNSGRSKQFLKLLKDKDGRFESMVQRVYRQIKEVDSDIEVTIATSKSQVSAIHNQLGESVGLSVEPCRRDTFAAIALACAYLHDEKGVKDEEPIVVCPVDPYVSDEYFIKLKVLAEHVSEGKSNLSLMGIQPTYPSEKYGYIIPQQISELSDVISFKEKPNQELAEKYLERGALWNGGIFGFKLSYLRKITASNLHATSYNQLLEKYSKIEKISFDYAVVEKEPSIQVLRYTGAWRDLGTWNTLTDAMTDTIVGDGIVASDDQNVSVLNELEIPIIALGVQDVIIAASAQGILVSDKIKSAKIKPYVQKLKDIIRFAEKSWGKYKVINVTEKSQTVQLDVTARMHLSYHLHVLRDESWTIVDGTGLVILNDEISRVSAGDVIKIPRKTKHSILAVSDLSVIETQMGDEIVVNDKYKFDFNFDKVNFII